MDIPSPTYSPAGGAKLGIPGFIVARGDDNLGCFVTTAELIQLKQKSNGESLVREVLESKL